GGRGLVGGRYSGTHTREQQVGGVVPRLVAELEKRFDATSAAKSATGIWPLPAYEPRLKLWPAEVSTDEQGVSLVMGATAAAIFPGKAQKVRALSPLGPMAAAIPHSPKLRAPLPPDVLLPLPQL